jgi:glycosyltransferase involved in cell wall biosynthesis
LLCRQWAEAGHEIAIIAFESVSAKPYYELHPSTKVIHLEAGYSPSSKVSGALRSALRVTRLRRLLKREAPDLVVSFLTKINVITLLASRGLDVPVIVCERNNPLRQEAHPLWWKLHERLRRGTLVLQTSASCAALIGHNAGAIRIIPNPIEIGPDRASAHARTIVAVGRLVPQKGFDILLGAFARIADDHPDWTLTIWGDGPEREKLIQQRDSLGLEARVAFPGVSDRPRGWIASGSVFALASRYEGFPNVLVEAMAAGFPVVSFDCAWGPGEIIEHGQDGLLVPAEDEVSLARALAELVSDPEKRQRLGQTAARNVKRFSTERVFAQWNELIESVTGAGGNNPAPVAPGARSAVTASTQ